MLLLGLQLAYSSSCIYLKLLLHDYSASGLILAGRLLPTVLPVFVVGFACIDGHEHVCVQSRLPGMLTAL